MAHSSALCAATTALATASPLASAGYRQCQRGVEATMKLHAEAVSHLLALQPFAPFQHDSAERLLALMTCRLDAIASGIEADVGANSDSELLAEVGEWQLSAGSNNGRAALCEAFGMEESPVDETGEFRPDWVLKHYAYRTTSLLQHLLPHLDSLGVPGLTDILAAVSVVGDVLTCSDPVTAWLQMDAMISDMQCSDVETRTAAREHLNRMEPAIRRAGKGAALSSQTIRDESMSVEVRANALADTYKRLLEGPFRQYAWARFCLNTGAWQEPPTLGVLRDRLVSEGGSLGTLADAVVLQAFRNGEVHETLVWDGFAEQFLANGVPLVLADVAASAELAQCFVAGSEAGLSALRFLDLPKDPPRLPRFNEVGRTPTWKRVQALFGINRLGLVEANLNTKDVTVQVERLGLTDVNPCFQALVVAHQLMPLVDSFSVRVPEGQPTVAVSAAALAASTPAWEFAATNLDQIPLATFLAANLDARRRHEPESLAIRSVAWIAVDDAVGVIDGSPTAWTESDRSLIDARLHVIELAVRGAQHVAGTDAARLRSVAESVKSLRAWVEHRDPAGPHLADNLPAMVLLRAQWEAWGPVPRHPQVSCEDPRESNERQPQLRPPREAPAFRQL